MKKVRHNKSSKYKRFLQVSLITLFVCFSVEPAINIYVFLSRQRRPQTEDWIFYQYQRKIQIATQITKRKIIIISGSSASFGISAKQIESTLGIPTVNLGVHAGLGSDYILSKAKDILKPNDIVLAAFEYPIYSNSKEGQLLIQPLRNYIISYDHNYLHKLSLIGKLKVILYSHGISSELIDFARAALKDPSFITFDKRIIYNRMLTGHIRIKENCYSEKSLNSNGDQMCNFEKTPLSSIEGEKAITPIPKELIDPSSSIKEFCIFAKKNNITVVPLYPAVLFRERYKSRQFQNYFFHIKEFWLKQDIPFKDIVEESFLKKNLMFNSSWHPNSIGRESRTKNVINTIKKSLIFLIKI